MEGPSQHMLPPSPRQEERDVVTCVLCLEDFCLEVTHATAAHISLIKASKWPGPTLNKKGKVQFWGVQERGELDIGEQH